MPALREGMRIFGHALSCRVHGPRRYRGGANDICARIVEECWERNHFVTSRGNYPLFYARDFGMCVDSLLLLGHRERVRSTLTYALDKYQRAGRVTQQIAPDGKAFNFPNVYQPDALAFLLHALHALGDEELCKRHRALFERELARFRELVLDENGLVRRGVHFAGMRDFAIRDASCYDMTMALAVATYAKRLGLGMLPNTSSDLLIRYYWKDGHFVDDRVNEYPTGDANVPPFWFKVVPDAKRRWRSVLDTIIDRQLDRPFPLRYEGFRNSEREMHWLDTLAGSWEHDTVWLHLGNLFLQVLATHDKRLARHYLDRHRALIERERNYPEVLTSDGAPHTSLCFHSDGTMLWAANFLALDREL